MTSLAPINVERRLPEAGRIRLGVRAATRGGKTRPKSIDTFRFTSPDEDLMNHVAAQYGGEVRPWSDPSANPPNQFEVISPLSRISVVLLPNCISQYFEEWNKGGCVRRCNGITMEVTEEGPNGHELVQRPCLCHQRQVVTCTAFTRITVVLPELPLRGVWRVQTGSEYALREIPGMLDVLHAVADTTQLLRADLSISKRKVVRHGETKVFTVPTLTLPHTPLELVAGQAQLTALESASSTLALPAATFVDPGNTQAPIVDDDGIMDAEVLDDPLQIRCYQQADRFIIDPRRLWESLIAATSNDRTRIETAVAKMESGKLEPLGFNADGTCQWRQLP